jgi:hypothetical protein
MPTEASSRKDRFTRALERAGKTQREWREEVRVSQPHLWFVLNGQRRPSEKLRRAIDEFIAQHDPAA